MATPYRLSNYSGQIDVEAVYAGLEDKESARIFAGITLPFEITSSAEGESDIRIGSLSKAQLQVIGERAAEASLESVLKASLQAVPESAPKKKN